MNLLRWLNTLRRGIQTSLARRDLQIALAILVVAGLVYWYMTRRQEGYQGMGAAQGLEYNESLASGGGMNESLGAEVVGGGYSDKSLVLFYSPNCGHCTALKPVWDQLEQKYQKDPTIQLVKVNGNENREEVEKHNVTGYPTIMLFKDGQGVMYNGDRSFEDIETFVST